MLPKMAPNSLFAVLLRSPWWASFALALIVVLVAFALLPAAYAPFGAAGALPFAVVGAVALRRQWREPRAAVVAHTLGALAGIPWRDFRRLLGDAYERQGAQVTHESEGPVDLVVCQDGTTTLVSARRWKAGNHGADALRALAEARARRDASRCVYVCLAPPGATLERFAREAGVGLLHGPALVALVGPSPAQR